MPPTSSHGTPETECSSSPGVVAHRICLIRLVNTRSIQGRLIAGGLVHQHRRLESLAHLHCQRDWVAPLPNLWARQEGLVDPHHHGLTPPEHGRYRTHQVQPDGMIRRLLEEGPVTLVTNGPQVLPGFQCNPHLFFSGHRIRRIATVARDRIVQRK